MPSAPQRHIKLLVCLLVAPALSLASSILVNGACEFGTCPPTDTLGSGGSVSDNFSLTYMAGDGDWYSLVGNFAASNPGSGATSLAFNVDATYEGNGGINSNPSAGADSFTVEDLQNFDLSSSTYFMNFGSLNGVYSESTDSGIVGAPTGSSWQAQLLLNSQALPVLGPFSGIGSASNNADLTGFTGSTLDADFLFTYDFAAGTPSGAGFTTSSTPEPGGVIPVAALLVLCFGIGSIRRSRLSKSIG